MTDQEELAKLEAEVSSWGQYVSFRDYGWVIDGEFSAEQITTLAKLVSLYDKHGIEPDAKGRLF